MGSFEKVCDYLGPFGTILHTFVQFEITQDKLEHSETIWYNFDVFGKIGTI